jgi:predicted RNase H-like nuclease (RuvC/YqgF family)
MPGWIWHRQATPDNVELVARIAQTLAEQAQAHEACIAEIQADTLVMANRENELHDEKDRKLEQQAREIERLKADLQCAHDIGDSFWAAIKPLKLQQLNVSNPGWHVTELIRERDRIAQATWEAAAARLAEELHKTPETRIDAWGVVEEFRARAAAQGGTG